MILFLKNQPIQHKDKKLIWSDEFNNSGAVDSNKWHHQIIPIDGGNWANGEEQHYTDQITNSYVSDGSLKIKAIGENYTFNNVTKSYTSARLNSKFAFQYGRIDVRAKLPAEAGTWPAIWTLGADINELGNYFGSTYHKSGGQAAEKLISWNKMDGIKPILLVIFIMQIQIPMDIKTKEGSTYIANSSGEFHTYSLIWTEDIIQILLDNTVFFEKRHEVMHAISS